jgi:hypothetical protein
LEQGDKTIWVTGDSDYQQFAATLEAANELLVKIGSVLRFEHCAVEDTESYADSSYRVLSVTENAGGPVKSLVEGVDRALTHSPCVVTAYSEGKYWKLEEELPENVYVILTTSEGGTIVDNNLPLAEVHTAGDEGTFVTMAVEFDYENNNVIIAEGERPLGGYMPMWFPEDLNPIRYGKVEHSQQGSRLFTNIINFATTFKEDILGLQNAAKILIAAINSLTDKYEDVNKQFTDISDRMGSLQSQVVELEDEKADLEESNSELESQVSDFETQITDLENQVSLLESDISSAKGSTSTWQMASVGLLIVGLVLGVIIGRMMKR